MFTFVSAPSQVDPALAAALRALRLEREHTQEDLAHRAGLTVAAYARIERGHANPTWTTVTRIAAALEITLVHLAEALQAPAPPAPVVGPAVRAPARPRRRRSAPRR